ncbi:MAG TPA: hypothetical protein VFH95_10570 [Candidatus Kapabacteria bacterium]|nr:hypothetical protein [Candidatus Kapabacteria bacterium]
MNELLTMSKRERHYLDVIHRLARYRKDGDAGLVHRHRGCPSNRGHRSETRAQVIELYKQREYRNYGPQTT